MELTDIGKKIADNYITGGAGTVDGWASGAATGIHSDIYKALIYAQIAACPEGTFTGSAEETVDQVDGFFKALSSPSRGTFYSDNPLRKIDAYANGAVDFTDGVGAIDFLARVAAMALSRGIPAPDAEVLGMMRQLDSISSPATMRNVRTVNMMLGSLCSPEIISSLVDSWVKFGAAPLGYIKTGASVTAGVESAAEKISAAGSVPKEELYGPIMQYAVLSGITANEAATNLAGASDLAEVARVLTGSSHRPDLIESFKNELDALRTPSTGPALDPAPAPGPRPAPGPAPAHGPGTGSASVHTAGHTPDSRVVLGESPIDPRTLDLLEHMSFDEEQLNEALRYIETGDDMLLPYLVTYHPEYTDIAVKRVLDNFTARAAHQPYKVSAGEPGERKTVLIPPAFKLDQSPAIWTRAVVTGLGFPFINFTAPAVAELLRGSDPARVRIAYRSVKAMFKQCGLKRPVDTLKEFARARYTNCMLNALAVDADELYSAERGTVVSCGVVDPYSKDMRVKGQVPLPLDFLTSFYTVLSPVNAARQYAELSGVTLEEYFSQLGSTGKPPVYILNPKKAQFRRGPRGGLFHRLFSSKTAPVLVRSRVGSHDGGFLIPERVADAILSN